MNACVHGRGYEKVCAEPSTTRREGWPLCDKHATVWDSFAVSAAAADQAGVPAEEIDFVAYAKGVL